MLPHLFDILPSLCHKKKKIHYFYKIQVNVQSAHLNVSSLDLLNQKAVDLSLPLSRAVYIYSMSPTEHKLFCRMVVEFYFTSVKGSEAKNLPDLKMLNCVVS